MKSARRSREVGHITKGDIFDDLGMSREETLEAKIKADIWQALVDHIERHRLTQSQLANMLKVHQPDVSNLLQGKISRFSITKLIQFAGRMSLSAEIKVRAPKPVRSIKAVGSRSGRLKRSMQRA